jgi:arylsulfatase A-like enzyme
VTREDRPVRIRPRRLPAVLTALAVLVGVAACTSGASHHAAVRHDKRPNIIFVLTDDLSTDLVRYMPHVQALAQAGASFANYFVVDSLCCPSRASIFTGEYPHNTKVLTNGPRDGGYHAFDVAGDPAHSYGLVLHNAGYRTGFLGKYLNGYVPEDDVPAKGWDVWDVAGSDGYGEFHYKLNQNGVVHQYGSSAGDYLTDVLSGKAVKFVDSSERTGKPFALEVATFAPHQPATPAPRDLGSYPALHAPRGPAFDRAPTSPPAWLARYPHFTPKEIGQIDDLYRRRVEAVQAVDRMVGTLEQLLYERHLLKNTYFVFSSDNGFHMGQYQLMPGKQTAFDTDIRVPLIVAGPGIQPGRVIPDLASSVDLAPTFDELGAATPSYAPDGESLVGLLHGQPAPPDWQRAVLIEHHGPTTNRSDPDLPLPWSANPPSYEAMRTLSFLYVEYVTGEREYYDLRNDPLELHNTAADLSPAKQAALHRALESMSTCAGAQCREAAGAA